MFWNKTWTEYCEGFGNVAVVYKITKRFNILKQYLKDGEFWAGNELAHLMITNRADHTTLKIQLWNDRSPNSTYNEAYWESDYTDFYVRLSSN